ncbi:galactose mutarotase-like domain-containing protein [Polychytrium aggregatum]|uniref:galactose mutarotase-like domain-containing protein n=1 Tax=Polychytrium aggregatum TaxID=110093 RepID=UPI0022FE0BF4|nr:galactose mutarotase-like domain-containing protein [Polychytrium aggregatum]KAI9203288.1 galactose mutarotase-like domain-containing protein [Polychytrium aggregatum]
MQKHRNITLERLDKFLQEGQFSDVNLQSVLWKYRDEGSVSLSYYAVPDLKRISFDEASRAVYTPTSVGQRLGPSWATFWFKIHIHLPKELHGEAVLLLFDPECEALIWSTKGEPLQGITGGGGGNRHVDYLLTSNALGGENFDFFIEVACNGLFGNGSDGMINAPAPNRYYRLVKAEVAVPNTIAQALLIDMQIIKDMARYLPENSQAAADALYTANQIVNAVRPDVPSTLAKGKEIADAFFEKRKRAESFNDHVVTAVGHCHIDTAWLWTYDETKRKAARSWSTQTWVEMDCNIPSGEAMCRQFLYGQRFLEKTFGKRSTVFWLPDTFGYLPQIVKESGLSYFFTQKLSWNNINRFPHTTFWWKGLDGTSVLTHFSPADTYNAQATVNEIQMSVTNNKDRSYSDKSLLLFGNGDGGGGPLPQMLERLRRMRNIEGLPARVEIGDPTAFYQQLEQTSRDLVVWHGELYFELHRGTYTSQAHIKKYNRASELLMKNVDMLSALCAILSVPNFVHPKESIDKLWKNLLLNQFHDVLPGSSIELANVDAREIYKDLVQDAEKLAKELFDKLADHLCDNAGGEPVLIVLNPTPWPRKTSVVFINELSAPDSWLRIAANTDWIQSSFVSVGSDLECRDMDKYMGEGHGSVLQKSAAGGYTVFVEEIGGYSIKAVPLKSLTKMDEIKANVFRIYEDIPLFWDAWDVEIYHLEKGWDAGVGQLELEEVGFLRVVLKVVHPLSQHSSLVQRIIVNAGSKQIEFENKVDWHENRKMLASIVHDMARKKLEFQVNVSCDYATYETQFGFVQRPTHYNNSWDMAKFEVCGHKFVDYSEYGFGVSLLNDSKYGFSVHENTMRMSLLRAPKAPDEHCDMGEHTFRYALYPHAGTFYESDVVQAGYEFNVPLIARPSQSTLSSGMMQFFRVAQSNVVLDTIKVPEESHGKEAVLRFYESKGGRGRVEVQSALPIRGAQLCNVLEERKGDIEHSQTSFSFEVLPFKIITIRLSFE